MRKNIQVPYIHIKHWRVVLYSNTYTVYWRFSDLPSTHKQYYVAATLSISGSLFRFTPTFILHPCPLFVSIFVSWESFSSGVRALLIERTWACLPYVGCVLFVVHCLPLVVDSHFHCWRDDFRISRPGFLRDNNPKNIPNSALKNVEPCSQ